MAKCSFLSNLIRSMVVANQTGLKMLNLALYIFIVILVASGQQVSVLADDTIPDFSPCWPCRFQTSPWAVGTLTQTLWRVGERAAGFYSRRAMDKGPVRVQVLHLQRQFLDIDNFISNFCIFRFFSAWILFLLYLQYNNQNCAYLHNILYMMF